MTDPLDKQVLQHRLVRCLELKPQFPTGPIAEMLHELEAELREQLSQCRGSNHAEAIRYSGAVLDVKRDQSFCVYEHDNNRQP